MIKRQFYKQDHDNDKDDISDSSSDSESEEEVPEAHEEEEQEEDEDSDVAAEAKEDEPPSNLSTGSGYSSEESSADEIDFESSGSLLNDDEEGEEEEEEEEEEESSKNHIRGSQSMSKRKFESVKKSNSGTKDPIDALLAMRALKCRSVFKCRLCPRIVCLSEETMKAHLTSKRHARSEKLLTEGRLKFMLNSDGEAEEEPETHAERHARTLAIAQDLTSKGSCLTSKKKNRRSLRERKRLKRKEKGNVFDKEKEDQSVKNQVIEKEKQSVKKQAKKRRKNED